MSPAENYLSQLFGLSGKTALVVGGTGVLGGAMCDCLAAAGAYVYVLGNNAEKGAAAVQRIETAGGTGQFFRVNATSADDFLALLSDLEENGREPDILVNGAGVNSATPFLEITAEEWDRIMNVNLNAVRIACQTVVGRMLELEIAGSVINVASLSAIIPLSRVFTYSASKAAVLNLTMNLAREWAPHGIRVNAISPGFFPAEQNRKVLTEDRVASIMGHTPMNRFGTPDELAGAILLLASNTAGSFVTGSNLIVDGGYSGMTI